MSMKNSSYFSQMMESISQSSWGYTVKEKFKQFFNHGYDFISFKNSIKTNYSILTQSSEHQIIKLAYSNEDFEQKYLHLKSHHIGIQNSSEIAYKAFLILMGDKKLIERNPLKASIVLLKDVSQEDMPQAFEATIKAQYKPLLDIIINFSIFKNKLNIAENAERYIHKCIACKNENLMELLFEEIPCYKLLHETRPATSFLRSCISQNFHNGTKRLLACGITIDGLVKDNNKFPETLFLQENNSKNFIKTGNPSYEAIQAFFISNKLQKELLNKVSHGMVRKKI